MASKRGGRTPARGKGSAQREDRAPMLPGTGGTTPGGKRASDRVGDPSFEGYEKGYSLTDGKESFGGPDALAARQKIVQRHTEIARGLAGPSQVVIDLEDSAAEYAVMAAPVPDDIPEHALQAVVRRLEDEHEGVWERTVRDGQTIVQFTFGDGDRVAASAPGVGTEATRAATVKLAKKVARAASADEEDDDAR